MNPFLIFFKENQVWQQLKEIIFMNCADISSQGLFRPGYCDAQAEKDDRQDRSFYYMSHGCLFFTVKKTIRPAEPNGLMHELINEADQMHQEVVIINTTDQVKDLFISRRKRDTCRGNTDTRSTRHKCWFLIFTNGTYFYTKPVAGRNITACSK